MKCQMCGRPATEHVTEIQQGQAALELHLCDKHLRKYSAEADLVPESSLETMLATPPELITEWDLALQKTCSLCGAALKDFQDQGRLGCPRDYVEFEGELEDLLLKVHGANQHVGKAPKRSWIDLGAREELLRLQRDMQHAITSEDYERASRIRDRIREIESPRNAET
ncbi:MAG: UvrB/UvrC motif-containing protein [Planctomycetales bacterium]